MANVPEYPDEEAFGRWLRSMGPDMNSPPGAQERLRLRLLAALDSQESRAPDKSPLAAPKRRLRFLRAIPFAASFLLIVLGAWYFFFGPGTRPAMADFGEMLRRVREATTVAFNLIVRVPGRPEAMASVLIAESGQSRVTWSDGKVVIFDVAHHKILSMLPGKREARLSAFHGQNPCGEPVRSLRETAESSGKFDGREMLDGREVEVYRVSQPEGDMRVWVDVRRQLPVKIETRSLSETGAETVTTLTDLQWNLSFDESQFSLEPPVGYVLTRMDGDEPSDDDLIHLLQVCAERNKGTFPARLDARTVVELTSIGERQVARKSEVLGNAITQWNVPDDAATAVRSCLQGLAFVEREQASGTWRYAGEGVKLGDAKAPVCWWKVRGSQVRRIVYGDLHVEDAPEGNVPPSTELTPSQQTGSQ